MFGGVLNDVLIRATGRRRLGRSAVALTGKGTAAFLILAGVYLQDPFAAMQALALCKFFSDWSQASLWGTVTDIAGPASGRVFGIVNTAGNIGAFAAGPIMGYLREVYGWDALFFAVAGVYVVAALCWLVIDCTRSLVVAAEPG
jgi:dipeptide/tripeptide permease